MAERVGFEPTRPLRAWRFSRPLPSTTRPPLHVISLLSLAHSSELECFTCHKRSLFLLETRVSRGMFRNEGIIADYGDLSLAAWSEAALAPTVSPSLVRVRALSRKSSGSIGSREIALSILVLASPTLPIVR